jgi:hypothetical protein
MHRSIDRMQGTCLPGAAAPDAFGTAARARSRPTSTTSRKSRGRRRRTVAGADGGSIVSGCRLVWWLVRTGEVGVGGRWNRDEERELASPSAMRQRPTNIPTDTPPQGARAHQSIPQFDRMPAGRQASISRVYVPSQKLPAPLRALGFLITPISPSSRRHKHVTRLSNPDHSPIPDPAGRNQTMAVARRFCLALLLLVAPYAIHAFLLVPSSAPQPRSSRIVRMAAGSSRSDPLRPGDRVVVIGSSGGCGQLIRCARCTYNDLIQLIRSIN